MEEQEKTYTRRKRYKGKYPKTYKDKYKELDPDKYVGTVEHVIAKGSTPAGMHISIMVKELLEFFDIKPGQTGLDATLGYGGHTVAMLKCLDLKGHMYALDIDPFELPKTKERLKKLGYGEDILTIEQLNFSDIDLAIDAPETVDFVLADLGVSSMQIDNPDRGFSYKSEGPLDLRMDPEEGLSAANKLKNFSQRELEGMLIENSDEPYAEVISKAIISELHKGTQIKTTTQLTEVITEALKIIPIGTREHDTKKSCQRTFQALRIDVNKEYHALYDFLEKLPGVLAPGGKVAILSFHSGEDRLVKKSFRRFYRAGVYKEISSEIVRPTAEECGVNRRARSTKMRWAIKS